MHATSKQKYTIFKLTGWDVREADINKEQASFIISNSIKKNYKPVIESLHSLTGAIDRQNRDLENQSTKTKKTPKKTKDEVYTELHERADEAGKKAADSHTPTPVIVGTPTTPLGNEIDYEKKTYYVPQGVCGFAWVHLSEGRSSFARWAKKNLGAHKAYYGGVDIWTRGYGQSMELKEAYASAYAEVLREAGIDAYMGSRMD